MPLLWSLASRTRLEPAVGRSKLRRTTGICVVDDCETRESLDNRADEHVEFALVVSRGLEAYHSIEMIDLLDSLAADRSDISLSTNREVMEAYM